MKLILAHSVNYLLLSLFLGLKPIPVLALGFRLNQLVDEMVDWHSVGVVATADFC